MYAGRGDILYGSRKGIALTKFKEDESPKRPANPLGTACLRQSKYYVMHEDCNDMTDD